MLERFEAYHWHVQRVTDGNDLEAIEAAIEAAKAETGKPSLIAVRTVIGYGSPKAGTNKVHGEALGAADTAATKKFFGFPEDQSFYVPEDALANWRKAVERGAELEAEWKKLFAGYKAAFPELAAEFERTQAGKLKAGWEKAIPSFATEKPMATRNAGQTVMNAIAEAVPELFGGAADLTASTKTIFKPSAHFRRRSGRAQRVLWRARVWHVRGGERNGGARRADSLRLDLLCVFRLRQAGAADCGAHGGSIAVRLYARLDRRGRGRADARADRAPDGAARGAAHDGFPAGGRERDGGGWRLALERKGPCFFALTRQDLPVIDAAKHDVYAGVSKGAYVLEDAANPQVILIGTGSEVWLALGAAKLLAAEGIAARVVSFPSWKIFEEQSAEYKASVLPAGVPKLAVEAGATLGWWKYVGPDGDVIGLDRFGASAPGPMVMEELGFTRGECGGEGEEAC